MAKQNLNTYWAELIVEELMRCGVDYFVISPGSRSTPLVVAAARHKKVGTIVCADERNSGFHALGYARAAGMPAAVITTSATAAANLYPAIIEASNDNVPMVVLTADRPPELIDTGQNQTIDQVRMFGNYTRFAYDMPCPDRNIDPASVLSAIDQAVYRSKSHDAGPIHINCRYRKPLEPVNTRIPRGYACGIESWNSLKKPLTQYSSAAGLPSADDIDRLVKLIDKTRRGMIIAGRLNNPAERNAVGDLINKLSWPAYTDITSGLPMTWRRSGIIRYFDQDLLSDKFKDAAAAELVVHIGRRTTSKRIPLFFRDRPPKHYIVIKDSPARYDPACFVTMHVHGDIARTCDELICRVKAQRQSKYSRFLAGKARLADEIIADNIAGTNSISEPFVAREISDMIANGSCLFLSNSMPIRDMDLYAACSKEDVAIAANRGASGIDGVISTASGFAAASGKMTTLLIGDMAFIHDINALAVLKSVKVPVIAVVINNSGGGIFHFLPIAKSQDVFEEYFAAGHSFTFEGAVQTFQLDYYKTPDKDSFKAAYRQAVQNKKPAVIEVLTDRRENLKLRKTIKKQIIKILHE